MARYFTTTARVTGWAPDGRPTEYSVGPEWTAAGDDLSDIIGDAEPVEATPIGCPPGAAVTLYSVEESVFAVADRGE